MRACYTNAVISLILVMNGTPGGYFQKNIIQIAQPQVNYVSGNIQLALTYEHRIGEYFASSPSSRSVG